MSQLESIHQYLRRLRLPTAVEVVEELLNIVTVECVQRPHVIAGQLFISVCVALDRPR